MSLDTTSGSRKLERFLEQELFEQVPFQVAVIDRNYNIVAANRQFREVFGSWKGRRCFEVFKGLFQPCPECQAMDTFKDGLVRVADSSGIDRHGRSCHYVAHLAPLFKDRGEVAYVIEMCTELTETKRWQREYDRLFESVPCYITVIDHKFRITRANEKFREAFGDRSGAYCYQTYKRRRTPCPECPARLTFRDGLEHVSHQRGVRKDGSPAQYVVTTSPLVRNEQGILDVIEIATDITEVRQLETELQREHDFYESIIHNTAQGIIALDDKGSVRFINPAARKLLGWNPQRLPSRDRLKKMLPNEFYQFANSAAADCDWEEVEVSASGGERIPVRLRGARLMSRGCPMGWAVIMRDLRPWKKLETEKLEAERLAAVGQTVAGLAHTIKNMLMGLEGGMYMVDTGLKAGDVERIVSGWETLQRNFNKTNSLVKDFLSFSKGRLPELKPVDPVQLARDIVELYRDTAARQGVELKLESASGIPITPLDPEGMETCLTNLVSNGIDAVLLREEPGGYVILRATRDGDDLMFEVEDNGCGMDWEVKQKVFTTFFTTKGGKGTGLGLLTTRKIVQEHGGRMEVESEPDGNTVFRIRLPLARLNALSGGNGSHNSSRKEVQYGK